MSKIYKKSKKLKSVEKKKIHISIPKNTYDLLSIKIQKMNYRDIGEYIKKKLLVDLLEDENIEVIKENIISEFNKHSKVNRDKTLYVRIDEPTFNILSNLSSIRGMAISDFTRNIIKNYLENLS